MLSASRLTCSDSSPAPADCLFAALNDLLRTVVGPVALLRPVTKCFDSQRDDVDLLLSDSQRDQLLDAGLIACASGRIHCRIVQYSPSKTQLTLWMTDCSQKLMIDLWTSFDQLPHHRHRGIRAERLLNSLNEFIPALPTVASTNSETHAEQLCSADNLQFQADVQSSPNNSKLELRQLPPDIDLCLLIQHLATKRRKLAASGVRERITRACDRFASWSHEQSPKHVSMDLLANLRDVAHQLPRAFIVTPRYIAASETYLFQRLTCVPLNRDMPVLERRRRRGILTELRKAVLKHRPTIAVVGSDGAGKSSVVSALGLQPSNVTTLVAKKLYRRTLTYQLISGLAKRVFGTDRGTFDDHVPFLVTLRASAAMWLSMVLPFSMWSKARTADTQRSRLVPDDRLTKSPGVAILDRSIASFLISNRKTDSPELPSGASWIEAFIPPVTSVLLTVSYSDLSHRKQEMSALGHESYQRMLFEQALRQQPCELILLANLPSAQAAASAVCEIVKHNTQSIGALAESSTNRRATA